MKIIIAGIGKVGAMLTKQLSAEGYDLTLIDSNATMLQTLVERFDVIAVQGNCASMPILQQAGLAETDLLIATTGADETNLLCCMTAQGMQKSLHTIARIRNPDYAEQVHGMLDVFSISMVINPEKQAAREIERLLRYPGFSKRDTFAKGRVEIAELRIDAQSKLCNVSLSDATHILKSDMLVCIVLRNGTAITPDGSFVLKEGDRIFVTAPTVALSQLLKNLGILTRKVRQIIVCGGGRASLYLAQLLEKSDMRVHIIEQNYNRCVELAELLPHAEIIHDDASNHATLQKEHLDDCDALVCMTGMDELNMVISLYASKRGVPHVITKLSRVETTNAMLDGLSLGSVVCPKELCCNSVVRYVRAMKNQTGAAISVHTIADGQAEALEFWADEHTPNCGTPLKKLSLRPNMIISAITHNGKTVIPDGDACFRDGDTVVVVKTGDAIVHQLGDIFA